MKTTENPGAVLPTARGANTRSADVGDGNGGKATPIMGQAQQPRTLRRLPCPPIRCPRCNGDRMRVASTRIDHGPGEYHHQSRAAVGLECAVCFGEIEFSFSQHDGRTFLSRHPPP